MVEGLDPLPAVEDRHPRLHGGLEPVLQQQVHQQTANRRDMPTYFRVGDIVALRADVFVEGNYDVLGQQVQQLCLVQGQAVVGLDLEYLVDKHPPCAGRLRLPELQVIPDQPGQQGLPGNHIEEGRHQAWARPQLYVGREDEVGGGRQPRHVPRHVHRVVEVVLAAVGRGALQAGRDLAGGPLVQQAVLARDTAWDVREVEVDVKGDQVLDEAGVAAVPPVEDRVDRVLQIRAGGVDRHRDRGLPPLQQRLQVVQEGEVPVCGVGDARVTVDPPDGPDVVVQHPVLAPLALAELQRPVVALSVRRNLDQQPVNEKVLQIKFYS